MQEAFVRFLARFPEPPAGMNVRGYLLATARNIRVNQRRAEVAVSVDEIDDTRTVDDRIENDPVRALLLAEQRTHVQRAAAVLTARQRRALTLRELDDRSYSEIGAELGLVPNAVAQVVWRARTQLRRSIRRGQIDVEGLPADCRALLDYMSALADKTPTSDTDALATHMAHCSICRRTLASYQEAGSRLRGSAPYLPLVALAARVGTALRAAIESPIALGTAAAVGAVAVGGGAFVAHEASSSVSKAGVSTLSRLEAASAAPAPAGRRSNVSFVVDRTPAGAHPPIGQSNTHSQRRRSRMVSRTDHTFTLSTASVRSPATTRAIAPAPPFGAPAVVRTPEVSTSDAPPAHVTPSKVAKPAQTVSRSPAASKVTRGKSAAHAKPKKNPVQRAKAPMSAATKTPTQIGRGHASRIARVVTPALGLSTHSNGPANDVGHAGSHTTGKASPPTPGNPPQSNRAPSPTRPNGEHARGHNVSPSLEAVSPDAPTATTARNEAPVTSPPSANSQSEKAAQQVAVEPNEVSSDAATTPAVPPTPSPGPAGAPPVTTQDGAAAGGQPAPGSSAGKGQGPPSK